MDRRSDHWAARLPRSLVDLVIAPVQVEVHHDPSVPASKWRGYDVFGRLCWYRHHFSQWDASFDDDEGEGFVQLLRAETFEAWRGLAGRWIRRVQRIEGDGRDDGTLRDGGFEIVDERSVPRL